MSLLGYVFNRAANKQIPVYLMTHGPGFWRPTGVISDEVKDLALSKIKNAFEGGHLFKENDMKSMERLDISNLTHGSDGDPKDHYSIVGRDGSGNDVKDGLVQEDPSKQTQSK